jgi:hypothetical protein
VGEPLRDLGKREADCAQGGEGGIPSGCHVAVLNQ